MGVGNANATKLDFQIVIRCYLDAYPCNCWHEFFGFFGPHNS